MRASPLQSLCSSQLFLPSPKVFPFFSSIFNFLFSSGPNVLPLAPLEESPQTGGRNEPQLRGSRWRILSSLGEHLQLLAA